MRYDDRMSLYSCPYVRSKLMQVSLEYKVEKREGKSENLHFCVSNASCKTDTLCSAAKLRSYFLY